MTTAFFVFVVLELDSELESRERGTGFFSPLHLLSYTAAQGGSNGGGEMRRWGYAEIRSRNIWGTPQSPTASVTSLVGGFEVVGRSVVSPTLFSASVTTT